jgi:hypothetical protein
MDRAIVVTAGHCMQHPQITELTVSYPNEATGTSSLWYSAGMADVAVIIATYSAVPHSVAGLCPACGVVPIPAEAGSPVPVYSFLRNGGGTPVLSSGQVFPAPGIIWYASMPVAPGTSGMPVLTESGDLSGIVSRSRAPVPQVASAEAQLVNGPTVLAFARWIAETDHQVAFTPPQAPPPPPPPPNVVREPNGEYTPTPGYRWVSNDPNDFRVEPIPVAPAPPPAPVVPPAPPPPPSRQDVLSALSGNDYIGHVIARTSVTDPGDQGTVQLDTLTGKTLYLTGPRYCAAGYQLNDRVILTPTADDGYVTTPNPDTQDTSHPLCTFRIETVSP